ncbi:MAG: transposase family protein [Candidatus Binatia bacterium]
MDISPLLPDPRSLRLEDIVTSAEAITLIVTTCQPQASCPQCHFPSRRLHSRYRRLVADLPWLGVVVRVEVHTRRFRCERTDCPQRIFCERLPTVVKAYGRQTGLSAAGERKLTLRTPHLGVVE